MSEKLLIVISGPSGVGKGSILKAIELYCNLKLIKCAFNKIVLYNTRNIRKGEIDGKDYHYCYDDYLEQGAPAIQENKKTVAEQFAKPNSLEKEQLFHNESGLYMYSVRKKDLQALDINDIKDGINFLEIYDQFIETLIKNDILKNITIIRLFIAPFTFNEMKLRATSQCASDKEIIKNEMRSRIGKRRNFGLSDEDDADIEKRISGAVQEITTAFGETTYDVVLVNPCGEADSAWGTRKTMPTGDAKNVVDTLAEIIKANLPKNPLIKQRMTNACT
jgi:guanylate kinase